MECIKYIEDNFVDLGLPSGTLWMKTNLGATCGNTPESWYGGYYSYGELKEKSDYSETNYIYEGNDDELPLYDDIIYQTYHNCKQLQNTNIPVIPNIEQINELIKYTISEWVENYNGIIGLNGRIFIGKNNNTMFIPAAGFRYDLDINDAGISCYLRSRSRYTIGLDNDALYLYFHSDEIYSYRTDSICDGYSVRGVLTEYI